MEMILLPVILLLFIGVPLVQIFKQNKRLKEIRAFQDTLAPGMLVQLTAGVHGRIRHVDEETVDVEIAPNVVTTWARAAVLKTVDVPERNDSLAQQTQIPSETAGEGMESYPEPRD